MTRWRGLRVVTGQSARRTMATVEREPRTLGRTARGRRSDRRRGAGRRRRPGAGPCRRARPDRGRRRDADARCDRPGRGAGADVAPCCAAPTSPSATSRARCPARVRRPRAATRSARRPGAARRRCAGRVRRAVAGQQPRRRLRHRRAARHGGARCGAARSSPFGAGRDLADGVPAGDRRARRRPLRVPRLQRHRRDTAGRRGRLPARCRCGCRRAPVRWCRPDLDHGAAASYAAPPGRPTSWSCCRTGARSTPTRPSRCSARSAASWCGPAPTSSSVVTRTGCRASTSCGGVPVLHSLGNFVFDMDFMEQTMQGVVLQATFWGPELKAVRLRALRDGPADLRAAPGARGPGRADPRRRLVDQHRSVTPGERLSGATTPGHHRAGPSARSWSRSTTEGTSPGEW